jgi:hypothetical protein
VKHDGVDFMGKIIQTVFIRLKIRDSPPASQFIDDIKGNAIVVAISIPISDEQYFVFHILSAPEKSPPYPSEGGKKFR